MFKVLLAIWATLFHLQPGTDIIHVEYPPCDNLRVYLQGDYGDTLHFVSHKDGTTAWEVETEIWDYRDGWRAITVDVPSSQLSVYSSGTIYELEGRCQVEGEEAPLHIIHLPIAKGGQ
jgi:hypothetical protein